MCIINQSLFFYDGSDFCYYLFFIIQCSYQKIKLQIMKTEEPEWEGFEQFCDQSDTANKTVTLDQQAKITTQTLSNNFKSPNKQEDKTNKPKTSPNKKIKTKPKLPEIIEKIPSTSDALEKQKLSEKIIDSPMKNPVRQKKYERIPIVKREDDFRYTGNVFYRGFMPRSSDNYFRLLKDVNYDLPVKKPIIRNGQNLMFDSKFESGNLNIAFQVRKYQIEGDRNIV